MKRIILPLAFLAASVFLASASDFGLALSAVPKYGSADGFELKALATPWFSTLLGENASLFLSANVGVNAESGEAAFVFDVRRFEYRMVAASGMVLDVGRFSVSDASGLVVDGLLDGVRVVLPKPASSLRFGAYYTGLFNKDENYLYMSAADMGDSSVFLSSSHVVAEALYTRQNFFGKNSLAVEALGQYDLRAVGGKLSSQYLVAGLSGPLSAGLSYKAYGAAALIEETDEDPAFAGAAAVDIVWLPTGDMTDKVYAQVRWGSGASDAEGSAFIPITANPQGYIFDTRLSGLLAARGGYAARFSEKVAIDVSAGTFFKMGNDLYFTYTGVNGSSDSAWLGAEVFGSVRYVPASDVSLSLGGGVFIPNSGGAFAAGTAPSWLVSGAFLFSL